MTGRTTTTALRRDRRGRRKQVEQRGEHVVGRAEALGARLGHGAGDDAGARRGQRSAVPS